MVVAHRRFIKLLRKIIMVTKQAKLLKTLRAGKELTAKQIEAIGFANAYSAVRNLREREMVAVYGNKRTLKNGSVVTKYRIGTPTAAMAAQGFTA
jgi:predicted transcriptional regulator